MPPSPPAGGKIGLPTYAMWGLCAVVVAGCYVFEQQNLEGPKGKAGLPAEVQRVLPSGAYLMSACHAIAPCPLGI